MKTRNLSMLADFYQFSMAHGYFRGGFANTTVYFDMFFRSIPDNGGYVLVAGLEQLIDYIKDLHFSEEDLRLLADRGIDDPGFLDYLRNFRFHGDIQAMPEGSVAFPYEPLVTVRAPAVDAQLIETMLLLTINHQSLIATKTSHIVRAAQGRGVLEFGARRAHGADAAVYGARAAWIGGALGTSNVLAERLFGIPSFGTMAHSWVQMMPSEYDAFKIYAQQYPENCVLLVDTYNTLESGVPNAIRIFDEVLAPKGCRPKGIRLDSGDLSWLSKQARKMLDSAGYADCPIIASNSLNEQVIISLIEQGAQLDLFGVGENLITARSCPVLGGVYKLAAVEENGEITPRIKISEDIAKITNPSVKKTLRFTDRDSGLALADLICLADEPLPAGSPFEIFHPELTWKTRTLRNYRVKELQVPVFKDGNVVYDPPSLEEIRSRADQQMQTMPEEILRPINPHIYMVDLSRELWELKMSMLRRNLAIKSSSPQL